MTATIAQLEAAFDHDLPSDPRAAAETAYAIAVRYRGEDIGGRRRFDLSRRWAEQAIALLEILPSESVEQVAAGRTVVGGVPIPTYLHEQVVRHRLQDVLA